MIDLKKLEAKFDALFENETEDSFNQWLENKEKGEVWESLHNLYYSSGHSLKLGNVFYDSNQFKFPWSYGNDNPFIFNSEDFDYISYLSDNSLITNNVEPDLLLKNRLPIEGPENNDVPLNKYRRIAA